MNIIVHRSNRQPTAAWLIAVFTFFCTGLRAQEAASSFSVGLKTGSHVTSAPAFQTWAASEGLILPGGNYRNSLTGIDLMYQKRRISYLLSTEFDLPDFSRTKPQLHTFSFQLGYSLTRGPVEVRAVGGPGLGYSIIRFRTGLPHSLQALPYDPDEAFARSAVWLFRAGLLASYQIRTKTWFRPFIYGNAGLHQRLHQSAYYYGETEWSNDGDIENRFNAVKTGIPTFYRRSAFLSLGLGLKL
jgi:hypothetical protein